MTRPVDPPNLPAALRDLVAQLRSRIRRYLMVEGIALAVLWAIAWFWLSLAIDWLLEPPRGVRVALLAVGIGVCGFPLLRYVWWPLRQPLTAAGLALVIERYFPQFRERLVTAVELTRRAGAESPLHREMLEQTVREAVDCTAEVDLDRVFDPAPRNRAVALACLLLVVSGLFVALAPQSAAVWARRTLLFSEELWPRKTHMVRPVEGFENGVARIARGGDFELIVRADTLWQVPRTVQVRYRADDGGRGRANLIREGQAEPGRDPHQLFAHTFRGVLSPLALEVVGGDDRISDLRIEVVDSPTITEMRLDCRFPSYLERADRQLVVSGAVALPRGTALTVHATSNKPLVSARVERASAAADETALMVLPNADDPTRFEFALQPLAADETLLVTLTDTDGIQNREPLRLALAAIIDQTPQIAVRSRGIGSAITPRARIPLAGTVSDDYQVRSVWIDYHVDEAPPARRALETRLDRSDLVIDTALDVRELSLAPGQKLSLSVMADDYYDLEEGPHTGSGERLVLDVVTPDQLRALLENRELNLRRRLEQILDEVREGRELLARVEFGTDSAAGGETEQAPAVIEADTDLGATGGSGDPGAADSGPADDRGSIADVARDGNDADEAAGGNNRGDGEQLAADLAADDAAAGDAAAGDIAGDAVTDETVGDEPSVLSPQRAQALRTLRTQRVLSGAQKNAEETLGVARAFHGIYEELVNNRFDAPDLESRLLEGIAQPLSLVGEEMYPQLVKDLERLLTVIHDTEAGGAAWLTAQQQLDAVVHELERVLTNMLKLETFNEAVDLLRSIKESQEEINRATRERRTRDLRRLLED